MALANGRKKSKLLERNDIMELIQIVDENGNFTEEIMDKEEAHNKNLLHNEVACFIINDKSQVLLQKRSPNKRFHPGIWALCAGHVAAYETLEEAMLREIKEEVGLVVPKIDLHPFSERKISLRATNSHITYFYYVRCNKKEQEFKIQEDELSEVRWFNIDLVIEMIKNEDNRIVFGSSMIDKFAKLKNIK